MYSADSNLLLYPQQITQIKTKMRDLLASHTEVVAVFSKLKAELIAEAEVFSCGV